jgi:cold-inducible RNA-binding protein
MNIFVANLSREATDDALSTLFSVFGKVKSAKIVTDKLTGYSKGFGFVEMANDQEATEAIKKLTNTSFLGKSLVVKKAKSPTDIMRI